MLFRAALVLGACASMAAAASVNIVNFCSTPVDPGIFPAANGGSLGGFMLGPLDGQRTVTLPSGYSGRIWGRTGCDAEGNCQTGNCQGGVNCTSSTSAGPTLAEFTIDGFNNQDFFDVSVADGFNIAVAIETSSACPVGFVNCVNAEGDGTDCGQVMSCPAGTNYTVIMCG
ncbi:hypothetical protein PHLGIDRAFT_130311 [Phlebiopsis gigantea 11061_1 CR5-6]|uniref:Osmotin thaumatin-like protein n=1 Tax=Phlebiopsis gigantea (strain 11061_1 CR5-6) TaxID=745531 RepID=A0A0C3S4V6_PHLG1|nr:hypothetical protein PHLGIDRAFT_130311 [Phlebiopsis gigantea 11061_1 CR5-6]